MIEEICSTNAHLHVLFPISSIFVMGRYPWAEFRGLMGVTSCFCGVCGTLMQQFAAVVLVILEFLRHHLPVALSC